MSAVDQAGGALLFYLSINQQIMMPVIKSYNISYIISANKGT